MCVCVYLFKCVNSWDFQCNQIKIYIKFIFSLLIYLKIFNFIFFFYLNNKLLILNEEKNKVNNNDG